MLRIDTESIYKAAAGDIPAAIATMRGLAIFLAPPFTAQNELSEDDTQILEGLRRWREGSLLYDMKKLIVWAEARNSIANNGALIDLTKLEPKKVPLIDTRLLREAVYGSQLNRREVAEAIKATARGLKVFLRERLNGTATWRERQLLTELVECESNNWLPQLMPLVIEWARDYNNRATKYAVAANLRTEEVRLQSLSCLCGGCS